MNSLLVGALTSPALAPRECGFGGVSPDVPSAFAASLEEAGAVPHGVWTLPGDSGENVSPNSLPRDSEETTPRPAKRSSRSQALPFAIPVDLPQPVPTPPWTLSWPAFCQGNPIPEDNEDVSVLDATNSGRRSGSQPAADAAEWFDPKPEISRPMDAPEFEPLDGALALRVRIGSGELGDDPVEKDRSQPVSRAADSMLVRSHRRDGQPTDPADGCIEQQPRAEAGTLAPETESSPAALSQKPSDSALPVISQPVNVMSASGPVPVSPEILETREIAEPQSIDGPEAGRGNREFTVRMETGDDMQATVRIRETAGGHIDVQVRTPNPQLSASLRSEADSLKVQLESSGLQARIGETLSTSSGSSTDEPGRGTSGNGNGDGWGGSQADEGQAREPDAGQQRQRRSRWLEEMEKRNAD